MEDVRRLLESRPFVDRVPDQGLIVGQDEEAGMGHVSATRGSAEDYCFVYASHGQGFTVDLDRLTGDRLRAAWYDLRSGVSHHVDEFPRGGRRSFMPPKNGAGYDWILILDDVARHYPNP